MVKNKIYKLLRWSEKYTKTDMVYLASGGLWLTVGQIMSSLSSLLLAIAFANLLPRETYGVYKYVLSIVSILSIPTLSGMNTAVTQAVARGYDGSFLPALKTRIKWGVLGGVLSVGLAGYYFINGNTDLTISFLIASVFLPILDPLSSYSSILHGKKMFKQYSRYFILTKVFSVSILITTIFLTNKLFIILLAYFISWTLIHFIFLKITLRKISLNNKKDEKTIKYGKHLSFINLLGAISGQLDKILVFHFMGAVDLAIYSFAIIPIEQAKGVLKNVQSLAFPKFAQNTITEIKKTILPKIVKFSIIIFIITIFYVLMADILYKIFFPNYMDSAYYSKIFSISLVTIPLLIITSIFRAQKMTKTIYQFNIITSIFNIIIIFLSIYFYGIIGLIIARVMARFFNLFLSIFLLQKSN